MCVVREIASGIIQAWRAAKLYEVIGLSAAPQHRPVIYQSSK
jgi:hypothetical protein